MTSAGSLLPFLGRTALPRFFAAQPALFQTAIIRNRPLTLSNSTFSFPSPSSISIVSVRSASSSGTFSKWTPNVESTSQDTTILSHKPSPRSWIIITLQYAGVFVVILALIDLLNTWKAVHQTNIPTFVQQGISDSFFLLENKYPEVLASISPLRLFPSDLGFSGTETQKWFSFIRSEIEAEYYPSTFSTPLPFKIYNFKRSFVVEYFLDERTLDHLMDRNTEPVAQVRIHLVSDSVGRPRVTQIEIRTRDSLVYRPIFNIIPKQVDQKQPVLKKIAPKSSFDYPVHRTSPVELSPRLEALKEQLDQILVAEPDQYERERIVSEKTLFSWTTKYDRFKL